MKKIITLCALALSGYWATAQVKIGLPAGKPTSTLQVAGSFGTDYRLVTANTAVDSTYHTILANQLSGTITLTLPAAAGCTGRQYVIQNNQSGITNVVVADGSSIEGVTPLVMDQTGQTIVIVAGQTSWQLISNLVKSVTPTPVGNIYTTNGTLTGNRVVTMGSNSLNFTGASTVGITTTAANAYAQRITAPLTTGGQAMLQLGGATGTAAVGQSALIGANPNNIDGAYPISFGAEYVNSATNQGSADFVVKSSNGGASATKFVVQNRGNTGIGTTNPGSTLQVVGSVAANYASFTGNHTMDASDFYTVFNGTAAGTFTLPASAATMKGRLYYIKNTTAAQTLTVTPNGAETIDGAATVNVAAGNSLQLVNTGLTSGATWEVVSTAAATPAVTPGNIYTINGTLTGGRTVTMGANNLQFNSTTGTFIVNTAAGSQAFTQTGAGIFGIDAPNISNGRFVVLENGNTGVGVVTPTSKLDVAGTGVTSSSITATNTTAGTTGVNYIRAVAGGVDTRIQNNGGGYGIVGTFSNSDLYLTASGSTGQLVVKPTGNVGVGTTTPGSTLQVNGSLAANYTNITAASYTMADNDFYVVYNGTATSNFTLPVSTANMKGRLYTIKNTTVSQTLTVTPNGAETIDGSTSVNVVPGASVQLVNTGLTSGATWEVVSFATATTAVSPIPDLRRVGSQLTANHITVDAGSFGAGASVGTGINNIGVGTAAYFNNTTGSNNVAVGNLTMAKNLTGNNNTAVGFGALNDVGGDNNIGIGRDAGRVSPAGGSVTSGSNNISIGTTALVASGTASNTLNIGNAIFGTGMSGTTAAPAGNIGINTTTPGSTLQVNGSFAANYNSITAATYTMAATDFYVVFNGTAAGTFTLPASAAAMKGRLYTVKNTTAAQTLALNPNGAETIDGNTTISVAAGTSVQVVNTGLTSGATWEVVNFAAAAASAPGTIYTADGTLTGNRIVSTTDKSLNFAGNVDGLSRTTFSNASTGTSNRKDIAISSGTTTSAVYLGVDNGSGIYGAGAKGYLDNRSGGRMVFGQNTNEQMTILTNGNVGIGATAPVVPLEISNVMGGSRGRIMLSNYNAGTAASSGAFMGDVIFGATDGSGTMPSGTGALPNISGITTEQWSSTAHGSALNFRVIPNTTTSAISAMRIDQSGNVGIGATTPAYALHIQKSNGLPPTILMDNQAAVTSGTYLARLFFGGNNTSTTSVSSSIVSQASETWTTTATGTAIAFYTTLNGTTTTSKTVTMGNDGSFFPSAYNASTNNTQTLGTTGNRWSTAYLNTAAVVTSDGRLKTNIKNVNYGLADVMKMRPVSYNWKTDPTRNHMVGFIAQEMEKIVPEAVEAPKDQNDHYGMRYEELIPVLTKAIQEQQALITSKDAKIAEIEARLEKLEKIVTLLQQQKQ